MMFALIMGAVAAYAQQGSGDYYEGLSRKIGFSQMIPPHGLEITYDKTVHIIFPSPVRYVDLGSPNLIAGKADGAENVIRVKATRKHFRSETNMSVITEDGNFYTFNVKYADEPLLLNVEMCDFIHDGESVNRPNNARTDVAPVRRRSNAPGDNSGRCRWRTMPAWRECARSRRAHGP